MHSGWRKHGIRLRWNLAIGGHDQAVRAATEKSRMSDFVRPRSEGVSSSGLRSVLDPDAAAVPLDADGAWSVKKMTPAREALRDRALELREKGFTTPQICKLLSISPQTLTRWAAQKRAIAEATKPKEKGSIRYAGPAYHRGSRWFNDD